MARAELHVRVFAQHRGEWRPERFASVSHQNLGLLMLDGVIASEVVLEDTVSTELLGPGDLLRPWSGDCDSQLLRQQARWQILADSRLAVLGRACSSALARFPEVNGALMDRTYARAQRLATMHSISHLNSVERRLLTLFWHIAERWGRVTTDGVAVPLALSHRLLGEMIGARRPTVTVSLAALEADGKLRRQEDGTHLLIGEPAGTPREVVRRVVPHRRRLLLADARGDIASGNRAR